MKAEHVASACRAGLVAVLVCAMFAACAVGPREVHSLDGRVLAPLPFDAERRAELSRATADARDALASHPEDRDAFIWLGRRLAYEGAYQQAIEVFTEGLRVHPDSHRLLRHRGHRFITVREFERAVQDLSRAKLLASALPDTVEPDGAPNEAGIPRSTTRGNIHYHLGLAYYLLGRFDDASTEYHLGLDLAQNDDTLVSTGWWLYLAARQLAAQGEPDDGTADDILEAIRPEPDMDILENVAYQRLLLMARGDLQPEEVLPVNTGSIQGATLGYGVAAYLSIEHRTAESQALRAAILKSPWWSAFGYIAAEADRSRGTLPRIPTPIRP